MTEIILEAKHLTKTMKTTNIVEDCTISVAKGEILGLLGPNGAGKTTIIRMITGLISKSQGEVWINGYDLDQSFEKAIGHVGAIIENPEFYKYLSGWENLKQFARMSRKNITDDDLNKMVEMVHLTDAIHHKVKTYSLGMRQRLGIAQALMHEPTLLILDEPLNGLDPEGMRDFRQLMRDVADKGTAILISSHLLSEMEMIADRVVIIEKGKLTHNETLKKEEVTASSMIEFTIETQEQAALQAEIVRLGLSVTKTDGDFLTVEIKRDSIPDVIAILVRAGIPIYSATPLTTTLEDRFLSLTNQGGQY
ncbi:ABC transporter ATP-binding protein [Isobaculum melis]|uniref:ABC-2 type transport system ATP-binding protein n=1 Tax=Isobaculum melis TaxID=142588 RepID=A0A1H9PP21_9LACT|nr:ABC transporter ATP-binding protein [Isobaculum melis]SER50011.1 ABC-2 type transport system ATP-binding protein [Isobaculum melis]